MASRTLWTLAIIGFATWGIVYVPIPAWRHAVCRPQMYWDAVRFHVLDNRQVVLNCHFSSREKRNWQYSNSRMEQDKLENRTGKKLGRSGDWHHHQIDRLKIKDRTWAQRRWLEKWAGRRSRSNLCHQSKEWAFCACVSVGRFRIRMSMTRGKLALCPGRLMLSLQRRVRCVYRYKWGNWEGRQPFEVRKVRKSILCSRPASSSGETNMARNSLNTHAPQAPVFIERSFIVETTWTAAVLC